MNKKVKDFIIVKGAREHNLKNVSINIPKNKFVVFTGVSGSGKSSLAFNTIYAEGQRRYIDSLSVYIRQFMKNINKPNVDSIEGLSPSISIDQKTIGKNPRSTVATMTEIADYYRLLFSRIGIPYCLEHNIPIIDEDVQGILNKIKDKYINHKIYILAPVVIGKKGQHENLFENIKKEGFIRVRINKEIYFIDEIPKLNKNIKYNIEIVVDRLNLTNKNLNRLFEAIEVSFKFANRKVIFLIDDDKEIFMSGDFSCPYCDFALPSLEPSFFSFNGNYGGACYKCNGIGVRSAINEKDLLNNKELTVTKLLSKFIWNVNNNNFYINLKDSFNKFFGNTDFNKPLKDLSEKEIKFLFHGYFSKSFRFKGIIEYLESLYNLTSNEYTKQYLGKIMTEEICEECKGKRFSKKALSVLIGDKNIADYNSFSVKEALEYFENLKLKSNNKQIAKLILKEIKDRLQFLNNVGLGYLNLDRKANTLSGGESQRIRLATQIGSKLTGIIYVLDEPSIGLHQKDNKRLIDTLKEIRDSGNTVLVVEHDEDTIKESDFIVDVGPNAGINGGKIVASGTLEEIKSSKNSITGEYLSGKRKILLPDKLRKGNGKYLEIYGAKENNLKNINVKIPLGTFTCITGVSGSGKSTLISILINYLSNNLNRTNKNIGKVDKIQGIEYIDKIISVDQTPIGKTPRSNPATYTGVFDDIRDLFANTTSSKKRGYNKGRFSFNLKGGRCENCKGEGVQKIQMHFLPDVFVKCEVCKGKRYNEETLSVKYKDKNIYDILELSIEKALDFFSNIPRIYEKLKSINDVGLSYIKLGQFATTLSGGEAQRVKLSEEIQKKSTKNTLYILDEPSTGLHTHDVKKLIEILQKLVDKGNTVLIIEHNLDIIKVSDYIIDLGPDGGDEGGKIIAEGTPKDIVKNNKSYTGKYLKSYLR